MAEVRLVFTAADAWEEPVLPYGTIVAVHYGDYRRQEIWISCGTNAGNWYCLGSPYGVPAGLPQHPVWSDVVQRGTVTVLLPGTAEVYEAGWAAGRRDLSYAIESLAEDRPPEKRRLPDDAV